MRRHLTYANVMSTLGVFLALAGGYALAKRAGSDPDKITDGQAFNLGPDFKTVAKAPGVGKIVAKCSPDDEITLVGWKTTDHRVQLVYDREAGDSGFQSNVGEQHNFELAPGDPRIQFHVFGILDHDQPQVTATVGGRSLDDCEGIVSAQITTSD